VLVHVMAVLLIGFNCPAKQRFGINRHVVCNPKGTI
jgi:hypothetical protein